MANDETLLRTELKKLRAERKEIIEAYGDMAQRHPMHVNIGGLNPAAQRLYYVRKSIAEIESVLRGPKPQLLSS